MSHPVYLLAGDDELLLARALEGLLDELRADDPELDVALSDVSEIDHLPELRTASLFGGRTCVILRGAEALSGDLKREVEAYLEAPADDAVMVVVARGIGRIQKVARQAKAHGRRIDVKAPPDWDDRAWDGIVADELARLDRQADTAAIAALRSHAGTDTQGIASRVAQVVAAAEAGARITAADVERVVEGHGRQSGFAIADAVADRDPAGALVALRGALDTGDAPLAVLGAVVYRFRQLLQVRGGASASEAGISPAQHRRLAAISGRFNPGELAWCHDRLARLDLDLKGSDLPDELILELGLIDVATSRQPGAPWNPLAS